MTITCGWCGNQAEKNDREIRRQMKKGRRIFFDTLKCAMRFNNAPRKKPIVEKVCICGKKFKTKTDKTEYHFCSRSCRAKGGMTKQKREALDLAMKRTEGWKYAEIVKMLNKQNIPHETEFRVGAFLYDLALPKQKILIEFDGPDHLSARTKKHDIIKDKVARENNWKIIHIEVAQYSVIQANLLLSVLLSLNIL